jgi:Site-specific recombinase XerD
MSVLNDAAIQRFRKRVVGRSISESTWDEYVRWIRRFEMWCDSDDPGLATLEDFDTLLSDADMRSYPWTNLRGPSAPAGYAYKTRIVALSAVKKWVRREYGTRIPEQPGDIALGEPDPFDPTYLPRQRIRQIIEGADDACSNEHCGAALAVSYDAILRAVELTRLDHNDLILPDDADKASARLSVSAAKGSRSSTLTLTDATAELLRDLDPSAPSGGSSPLFTNAYGDRWTRGSWAGHVLRHHCDAGSHAFGRHSPILHMIEEEGFAPTYRRARHQNPTTTAKYARIVGTGVPEWAQG